MISVDEIEKTIGDWLKPLPHLPNIWRKWLAKNIWWIVLVCVILSAIGALTLFNSVFITLPFIFTTTSYLHHYSWLNHDIFWVFSSLVSLSFTVITLVVSAMAISSLKSMKKNGWSLLLLGLVINGASVIVGIIIKFNILNFIPNIVFAVIGFAFTAYLLYEIRSYFKVEAKVIKKK
ncbi:MAG: hypothetical protein PWQ10_463 [Patescibacteria group bacterium]|nr:hypothetical protein [Patescibacteria group bacterium]